jgi:hypothetical protein
MGQRQQGLGEQQALANVGLTQRGQDASLAASNASASNQAQSLANQYDIQNRNMMMQEKLAPIQYVNALRAGSQAQMPQFSGFANQANLAGPDIAGAGMQAYNAQMNAYNADQAANAGLMGGLMSLGGAALMSPAGTLAGPTGLFSKLSDIRTKENIKQIGQLENGLGVYEYTYKPEFDITGTHVGVMAQEVIKVKPEAIVMRDDGYMAVNYAMI